MWYVFVIIIMCSFLIANAPSDMAFIALKRKILQWLFPELTKVLQELYCSSRSEDIFIKPPRISNNLRKIIQ